MRRRVRALRTIVSASAVALTVATTSTAAWAAPGAPGVFRVKRPTITPADAATKRAAAQVRGNALVSSGEAIAAGIEFDNAAAELGDPVLYLDAGEAYLTGAEESRNTELAQAAVERGKISLDILYFHLDAAADEDFRLVEATQVPELIVRSQALIEDAQLLMSEIEAELAAADEAPTDDGDAAPKPKNRKAGKIAGATLIVAGGVMLGIGAAGLALGVRHQQSAEHSTVYGKKYDAVAEKGKRANTLAYVGVPVGLVLAGVGVAVLVLTSKKRKEKRKKKGSDTVSVVPTFDTRGTGLTVVGRF